MKKKNICLVVTNRANFARMKSLLIEIKKSNKLSLQIILSGSALSHRFGQLEDELKKNKLPISAKSFFLIDGGDPIVQAKSTSLAITEFATIFSQIKPDLTITVGDRYETMATAIASTYMNIPLAHIQGGEVSGNLDEIVRHSITKLSSYHFTTTKKSKERVLKLGEEKSRVFFSGCPGMDILRFSKKTIEANFFDKVNYTGNKFNFRKSFLLVVDHPVSTESKIYNLNKINILLKTLAKINIHKVMFWPNSDAHFDVISSQIRTFKEKNKGNDFTFVVNASPEDYASLIYNASCLVGNSSSFIREGSQLGVPAVLLGNRQLNREIGKNVIYSNYNVKEIIDKIKFQIKKKSFVPEKIYGRGNSGKYIVKVLEKIDPTIKKQITY
jgi:UDP-hydrolysing UDP-N-acetyl-D-glucosamine 2-epimerase